MKTIASVILCGLLSLSFVSPSTYSVGDTVPNFSLKNIDGKKVSLESYKDKKGVIVIFDCNTCPVSKAYNSRILDLAKKYEATFPVLLINANDPEQSAGDSFDEMVVYAKDHGYTFPYLVDETQAVAKTFGATNTPHVFVLSQSGGAFTVAYIGAIDDNTRNATAVTKKYAEQAIDALLEGKKVSITKTKAVGCGIKWM